MILPRKDGAGLSDLVSAGLPSVAVRVPAHKTARALIRAAGVPIALSKLAESGRLHRGQKVAILGIGSGINCTMAELLW